MIFSTNSSGKIRYAYVKIERQSIPPTKCKTNSKWTIDLNWKPKIIKLLEENTEANLCALVVGKDFLDLTPKAWLKKEKKMVSKISSKLRTSFPKTFLREWKDKPLTGKGYHKLHTCQKACIHNIQRILETQ